MKNKQQTEGTGERGIVRRLQRRRNELGLTLNDLAQMSGLGINTLSRMERGQASPTLHTLLRAAHILGLEMELRPRRRMAGGQPQEDMP